MNEEAGKYCGLTTDQANEAIFADLQDCGALYASEDIIHQYPHCWRCKSPIIYRATDQWFCSVDAFKDEACAACDDVQWMPEWGQGPHDRHDPRARRLVHLPPAPLGPAHPRLLLHRLRQARLHRRDHPARLRHLPREGLQRLVRDGRRRAAARGLHLPPLRRQGTSPRRPTPWTAGSTPAAPTSPPWSSDSRDFWPADMYLEGGDQFRGWFQSSLLTGVATKGSGPLQDLPHPRLDRGRRGQGHAQVPGQRRGPPTSSNKYGADLVRLWAACADYHAGHALLRGHLQAAEPELSEDPQHRPVHAWATWTASTPTTWWPPPRWEPGPLGRHPPERPH